VFFPCAGYISDPQLASHNAQRAAEARGAVFRFNAEVAEIRRVDGRVAGVTLGSGEPIDAPVVVNIAGPHSYKINRMAGVEDGMKIKTRPPPLSLDCRHAEQKVQFRLNDRGKLRAQLRSLGGKPS
jgi:sarcosine oxidase subunit beta